MKDEGMIFVYYYYMGLMIEDGEDVDWLMELIGFEVMLFYDIGYLLFGGVDLLDVLKKWGDCIYYVYYKDVCVDVINMICVCNCSFFDVVIVGVFIVLGDGCIDFDVIMVELVKMNYFGWIVVEVEQDFVKVELYVYFKMGYDYIVVMCVKYGLIVEGCG